MKALGHLDHSLAEASELEPDDFRSLKAVAIRAIDHYCQHVWKPNDDKPPGRREVKERDALIVRLAEIYYHGSGWDLRYEEDFREDDESYVKRYQHGLIAFIAVLLSDYDRIPFSAVGFLDKLSKTGWNVPRDTRKKPCRA